MQGKTLIPGLIAVGLVVAVLFFLQQNYKPWGMDAENLQMVELGKKIYGENCATDCHGTHLEGQPDWRSPLPEGGLPAPPHDDTGHTWHHDDQLLFDYVQKGGAFMAPKGFQSNMPAFGELLSDKEIWAVLSYIKSTWSEKIRRQQEMRNNKG